jgi:hypothetical protein
LFGALDDNLALPWTREEIHKINHAVLVYVSRLQDVGGREILLLRGAGEVRRGRDGKVSSLVLIEQSTKE